MKIRTLLPALAALLFLIAIPVTAEEGTAQEALFCSAATQAAETVNVEQPDAETADAEDAVENLEPLPMFQAIGQCNCTLGQPCSVPCPSPTQQPRCLNTPCLSISSQLNGVCTCV